MIRNAATYCNPFSTRNFPDPFVLKVRGRYYAYASDEKTQLAPDSWVFPILSSENLLNWQEIGLAMPILGKSYFSYWAPEVTMHNGLFYLYYAVHQEEFLGAIRVAVAERPEGPFIDTGYDLTSSQVPWAIDPHVFHDIDGQWYLYMTIEYTDPANGFVGSGNAVDRLLDPFTLQGQLTRVTAPSQSWQLFERRRASKGGLDWYTVEGPAVLRHRQKYYEMYSGGCYYGKNYAVSYATSDRPMGDGGLVDRSWQERAESDGQPLLLRSTPELNSPGHNSVVLGPNNVDQYIIYHAWQADRQARRPCLDRLYWLGTEPYTPAPTSTPQPAPSQPRLHELFMDTILHPIWQGEQGEWEVKTGELLQKDLSAEAALLSYQQPLPDSWLCEIHARHIGGTGTYGLQFCHSDGSHSTLTLTSTAQLCYMAADASPVLLPLPVETTVNVWQQLLLSYSGSLLSIHFAGLPLTQQIVPRPICSFALLTEFCSAAFSAITLTEHFCDEFLQGVTDLSLLGWQSDDGIAHWQAHTGSLEQQSTAPIHHSIYKGSPCSNFDLGATLRLLRPAGPQKAAGILLYQQEQTYLAISLSLLHEQTSLHITGHGLPDWTEVILPLPTTFDPYQWHTLRCELLQHDVSIYLDKDLMLQRAFVGRYRIGLFTSNTSAAYMRAWQTAR